MKKLFTLVQPFLIFGFVFSAAFNVLAQNDSKKEETKYKIARYVIGSGGIMGAHGANYVHSATAGQTVVGIMQGANHSLLSGYWSSGMSVPTGVQQKENTLVPKAFELYQNYPNPFNPQTKIEYELRVKSKVTIEICNLVGRRIRLLTYSQNQGPGFMQVVWDGCNDQGILMGSGVYLYRITITKANPENPGAEILFQQTRKMSFVK